MRAISVLLLLASTGLSECATPTAQAPPTAAAPAAARTGASFGVTTGGVGPAPDQRRVQLEDVVSGDTVYAATLPARSEADGAIRVRVVVNPRAHTLEKISVLFAPHSPRVSYRQLGLGVGKYDAKMGHYYFNVAYQKVRKLDDGRTDSGDIQEITGWVAPSTNAAAVAQRTAR